MRRGLVEGREKRLTRRKREEERLLLTRVVEFEVVFGGVIILRV